MTFKKGDKVIAETEKIQAKYKASIDKIMATVKKI